VNWSVQLVGLKFLNRSGSGSTSDAVSALQYAVQKGIRVSNNSWGGGGYNQALYDAINEAKSIGHLFVAAAGNSSVNTDVLPHYPSSYNLDNVISVASITSSEALSSFSNYGATSVDLGAPGSSIYSTLPGNNYGTYSGTSMAAPHVSGAVAMLLGYRSGWSYTEIRDAILLSARPIPALLGKTVTGGTLDLWAAVVYAPDASPPNPPSGLTGSRVSSTQVTLDWMDNSDNEAGFYIERASGSSPFTQIGAVTANVTTFTDSGLEPSTLYAFRVRAHNSAGSSAYSNQTDVQTPALPPRPSAPTMYPAALSGKTVTLSWSPAPETKGYEVGRASYNSRSKACGALNVIKSLAASVTSTTDTRNSGTYCYAVRAYNDGGASDWSNQVQVAFTKK
jgi:hypothetical protein